MRAWCLYSLFAFAGQVQINCENKMPCPGDSFNEYLATVQTQNGDMPSTVQQLEAAAGVKLIVSDKADPENAGFVQWRVGFYCTDAANTLRLLDGWFQHKEKQIARESPLEVVIHPHVGIDLSDLESDLSEVWTLIVLSIIRPARARTHCVECECCVHDFPSSHVRARTQHPDHLRGATF